MANSWSNVTEAFDGEGILRFPSGLVMDLNQPLEWPQPFPQIARLMLARDLCNLIDTMRTAGFEFRPMDAVTPAERESGARFFKDALAKFAAEEHQNGKPSLQNDWHFGAILIAAIQFAAKVEADIGLVIAPHETPGRGMPPDVMGLLHEFIALDREKYEIEARSLSSLAAQDGQTSRTIQ